MSNLLRKRAINFDLNTADLKKFYPKENYREAYKDIKNFLCSNGFKHRQWSGYVSEEPINEAKVDIIVTSLKNKFPWFEKCVRRFDATEIGEHYDLLPLITDTEKIQTKEKSKAVSETKTLYPNSFVLDSNNDNNRNLDIYKSAFESGEPKNKTSFLSATITVKKEKSLSELLAYAKEQYQKQSAELENAIGKDEISNDIEETER